MHLYEFSSFLLNPAERTLSRRDTGQTVPLTPKAFETLLVLIENRGHVLTKEKLIERVWPNSFVEENNLAQHISALRKVLGETGADKFIETVPRRGYRFVGEVFEKPDGEADDNTVGNAADNGSHEVATGEEAAPATGAAFVGQTIANRAAQATDVVGEKRRSARPSPLLVGVFVAALVAVGFYVVPRLISPRGAANGGGRGAVAASAVNRTLAILPFRNLKPDAETDFLGFSLADAVVSKLSYVSELTVRPSSYTEKYRGQAIEPASVAGELNVDTLLTGSFLKEGDDLRITAQMVDVRSKNVIWHDSFDLKYEKLLTVQDRVAGQIIRGLELKLSEAEAGRLKLDAPRDPLAYEYYLRGVDRYAAGQYGLAREMLLKSLELDGTYALAWAHLGTTYNASASMQFGGRDHYDKALQAYNKALQLNPELIEAQVFLANHYTDTNRAEQAAELLREASKANPNYAMTRWELGYAYRFAGVLRESIDECERARAIDPQVKLTSSALNGYLYLGDYDSFLRTLPAKDDSAFILFYRGLGEYYRRNHQDAAAHFDRAYAADPELLQAQIGKALSHAIRGEQEAGRALLRGIETKVAERGVKDAEGIYKIAQAYSVLGEREAALRVLRRSIEGGFFCHPYFATDALLKNLRDEPEFRALLEQARQRHEEFKKKFF